MDVRKAVITAAGRDQRALPLQTLVDRDGVEKKALEIILEEAVLAGAEEVASSSPRGTSRVSRGRRGARLAAPVRRAARAAGVRPRRPDRPGVHRRAAVPAPGRRPPVPVPRTGPGGPAGGRRRPGRGVCRLGRPADPRSDAALLRGGRRPAGRPSGPTCTRSRRCWRSRPPARPSRCLLVPGLRAGFYLCFFGVHVLTPAVMDLLAARAEAARPGEPVALSPVLAELARRERYLALEVDGQRYNIGVKYGLLTAQLALALDGVDREKILAQIVDLLAQRA